MKIIDERETQKKKKKQRQKRTGEVGEGSKAIVKGCELDDFVMDLR